MLHIKSYKTLSCVVALCLGLAFAGTPLHVQAQDVKEEAVKAESATKAKPKEQADKGRLKWEEKERLKWAKKMHELKPTRDTIGGVIDNIALQIDEGSRGVFKDSMMKYLDVDSVENASIEAMVDVFSSAELKKMYQYSSSPEGRAIHNKMPVYQTMVEPSITKALDDAMVQLRFGANPE